jgi:hypothetical protein
MSLPLHSSHFASLQVIVNAIKNICSVIDKRVNSVDFLMYFLPKLHYSHVLAYRDL